MATSDHKKTATGNGQVSKNTGPKVAAEKDLINEDAAILECLTSIKRAGADMILTYFAPDAAKLLA